MEILVQIMVGLFMSGIGLALAAGGGGELGLRDRSQPLASSLKIILVCFTVWIITAILLVVYQSWWYSLSLAVSGGYFWLCFSGASASLLSEEISPLTEGEPQRELLEQHVNLYEKLLAARTDEHEYLPESSLPTSKKEMATALQTVYWFRLMALDVKYTTLELITRYSALSHFIEDDDAVFMNEFINLISRHDECVAFVKIYPELFNDKNERMHRIFAEVEAEDEQLDEEWDASMGFSDDED